MVRMRMSDFTPDVPKSSNAHAGAVATGPRGPSPELSPPPLPAMPLVSLEQLLAMLNELMRVLTKNLMHCGGR
jgi:hypothetical protein